MPAKHKPHPDPRIEAQIQRSLKRYEGRVPQVMLDTMREILEDALTTHPTAKALVDAVYGPADAQAGDARSPQDAKDPQASAEASTAPRDDRADAPPPVVETSGEVRREGAPPPVVDHSGEVRSDGAPEDTRKSGGGDKEGS
jgi:hypothetical protein